MCGGTNKIIRKSGNTTDIMYDGSSDTFNSTNLSKDCTCGITNNAATQIQLTIYIIDIRLHSYYLAANEQLANCSSAKFDFDSFALQCVQSTNPFRDNFRYLDIFDTLSQNTVFLDPGKTTEMNLTGIHRNGARDAPAMVWVQVTCKYSGRHTYCHYWIY